MIFKMRVLQWIPAFAGMTGNACWNGEQAKTIAGVAKETLVAAAENFSCHTCVRRYPL